MRERDGANGEVGAGRAALEEWVNGELEARRRSGERRRCSGVWGRGNSMIVRGIGRGDPPVLMRTKEGAAGTLSELATATKMWRPAVVSGARGKERRAPALRQGRWRRSGATRGRPAQAGGGLPVGPERRRRQGKQRRRQEVEDDWTSL